MSATAKLRSTDQPAKSWLVTRATHAVASHAVEHPISAALWVMGITIGHAEHAGPRGGMIDLPASGSLLSGNDWQADTRHIVGECTSGDDGQDEIA